MTSIHPFAIVAILLAAVAMLTLPRRWALAPMVLVSVVVAPFERVAIFGLDFSALRILVVVGTVRVFLQGENRGFRWNGLDKVLLAWTASRTLIYTARKVSAAAFVTQLGNSFDVVGYYFLGRLLIRSWKDLDCLVVALIAATIPIAFFFSYEASTGTNPFGFYESISHVARTRAGEIRAHGAFSHSILAGAFFVSALPLVMARMWRPGASKLASLAALAATFVIVETCRSSTPIIGLGVAGIGAGFYLLRSHMRAVRWGIVAGLLFLQVFVMQQPLWHLFYRVGALGISSSTGYHRFRLFDAFVHHWRDWILMGVSGTGHWGRQMHDTTSYILAQGMHGGIITLVLFGVMMTLAFSQCGQILKSVEPHRSTRIFAWGLAVAVLGHLAMMNAVSYYDQVLLVFFLTLAAVGSLTPVVATRRARAARTGVGPAPRYSGPGPAAQTLGRQKAPQL